MTEELKKKAEESAYKNCPIPFCWNEIDIATQGGYKKGYIAGATENGIQWHDLKKDPNDLPKYNQWILTFCHRKYDDCEHYFATVFYSNCFEIHDVIAWCEIPQFNSED